MTQTTSAVGNGNYIIQIQGDGNSVVTGLPHLELTRRRGLASHIETDSGTGKPREIDVIRPLTRSIEMMGREVELADLRAWLHQEKPISVRVITGAAGYGKTRLALELIEEMVPQGWRAGFLTRAEMKRFREQRDLAGWGWNAPILAVVDYASASARDLHAWLKKLEDSAVWDDAETNSKSPLHILLLERQAEPGYACNPLAPSAVATLPCRGRQRIVGGFLWGTVLTRTPSESCARLGSSCLVRAGTSSLGRRCSCGQTAATTLNPACCCIWTGVTRTRLSERSPCSDGVDARHTSGWARGIFSFRRTCCRRL